MTDAPTALAQVREALEAGPTPGEWVCYDDSSDGKTNRIEIVAIGKTVARIYRSVQEQDLPNARLIAACSPANMTAILAHVEAQAAEIERLRKFAGRALGEARQFMSDVDGGDVQAWAVECGLLEEWTPTEPCGEQCECAEVADFPTQCFRLTETGKAALDTAKEQR